MKSFLIKLISFVAIQAVILTPLVYIGSCHQTKRQYLCSMCDKLDRLKTASGPRIIFVGGSSLAFGLDSKMIAKETGYNPINLGVHAGLGVRYQVRMIKQHLRSGDLVVLAPEYRVFHEHGTRCSEELAVELYDLWPGCLPYIQPDLDVFLAVTKSPLHLLADRIRYSREYFFSAPDTSPVGTYERGSFNEFGDHVNHYGVDPSTVDRKIGDLQWTMRLSDMREAIDLFNDFTKHCQASGAHVVFAHAPVSQSSLNRNPELRIVFEAGLASSLDCPIITNLDDLGFGEDMLFDSAYHLSHAGVTKRTAVVCEGLKRYQSMATATRPKITNVELR